MAKTNPEPQNLLDDELSQPKPPSKTKVLLRRILLGVLLSLSLAAAYLFLLLGEPEEEAKNASNMEEAVIQMPMSPLESPGEANVGHLADTFGEPVMAIGQGLEMQKARVYDTAFSGGYARRVTLTYAFSDGAEVTVESIRPTLAVTLLEQSGYQLDASALYTMGGLNAGRMDNAYNICVFAQNETAVYAVICPKNHEQDLDMLLRQTTLILPQE